MTVISIPRILQEKLTAEGADALVGILDKVEERSQKATLEIAEERFERRLAQVDAKIEQVKAEIIKWMFIFIVGQFWAIVGVMLAFFRK